MNISENPNGWKSKIADDFEALREEIVNQREHIQNLTGHPAEKGIAFEQLVHDLLRKFLPVKYGISSGFVINSYEGPISGAEYLDLARGGISRQCDCIIYDQLYNTPICSRHNVKLFPIEMVYMAIEIKGILNKKELIKAIQMLASVSCLVDEDLPKIYKYTHFSETWRRDSNRGGEAIINEHEVIHRAKIKPAAYIVAFEAEWRNSYKGIDRVIKEELSNCRRTLIDKGVNETMANTIVNAIFPRNVLLLKENKFYQLDYRNNNLLDIHQCGIFAFIVSILNACNSMPMHSCSIEGYFPNNSWHDPILEKNKILRKISMNAKPNEKEPHWRC